MRATTSRGRGARVLCGLGGAVLLAAMGTRSPGVADEERATLRVCADPNNLPFSTEREEGFENRIAELFAEEMGAPLEYTWWAQRRGFLRNPLNAGECDVVMGVPSSYELVLATRPYYRSAYMFLHRADREWSVESLDDPTLRELTIGVHLIGDDYTNTPPAHALGRRQITDSVVGFMIYGDYTRPNTPARLVEAATEGKVDLGVVWAPLPDISDRASRWRWWPSRSLP